MYTPYQEEQQLIGKRDLLTELGTILDHPPEQCHQRIETLLFNAGVRPLGQKGEEVEYDYRIHETPFHRRYETRFPDNGMEVADGDRVVILMGGRQLKEGSDRIVITKALTIRVP